MASIERPAAVESLTTSQELLQSALASGQVPVEDEVQKRFLLARTMLDVFRQLRHNKFCYDAIHHLETILRRVPQTDSAYSKYANTLSEARSSEYLMSGSRRALEQAIEVGRVALACAGENDLRDVDVTAYLDILSNLSFALSHRSVLSSNLDDLDECLTYTREIYETAPRDSNQHTVSLNNLVSRMARRLESEYDKDYVADMEIFTQELLGVAALGTVERCVALGQIGSLKWREFLRTGDLTDLDAAIQHCKECLEHLSNSFDGYEEVLKVLVAAYARRYHMGREDADLSELVNYSQALLEALPINHGHRDQHLLEHLHRVLERALKIPSLPLIQQDITNLQDEVVHMPTASPRKQKCQIVLSNLMGARYSSSTDLKDLMALVSYLNQVMSEHNRNVGKPGSAKQYVDDEWISTLERQLNIFDNAPSANHMRVLVEDELAGAFLSCFNPDEAVAVALERMFLEQRSRLRVLARAIKAGIELNEDEIKHQMGELEPKKGPSDKSFLEGLFGKPKAEYKTEFGLRTLAIESGSKDILWDMPQIMSEILGYDTTEPMEPAAFFAREAKMEQQAIEKLQAEGRQPNPKLCRVCRDFVRPLRRTERGLTFTSDHWLPFGNFFQLLCRKHCAICRHILSAITTESGQLHPELEKVDQDVQGTRLSMGVLSSGENVMRVDYGLKPVCEIRLVTSQTYVHALRQGWEVTRNQALEKMLEKGKGAVYRHSGQQVDISKIKRWLSNCDHNHGQTCNRSRSETKSSGQEIPLTFIDVIENKLVAATSREKYIALSYVWGRVEMSSTTRANRLEREATGALSQVPLPDSIKDAIALVRSLEVRFLWVDAICMVQDDEAQMARDIPLMDVVYGKAFATVVALHGVDAGAGLPGVMPGTRLPQEIETVQVTDWSTELDYDPQGELTDIVGLVATPIPLHLALDLAKWNRRGWTFQEHLLSTRCLYFSPRAVYFQCGKEVLSEYGTNENYQARGLGGVPIGNREVLPKYHLQDNPLRNLHHSLESLPVERLKDAFKVYMRLVERYSHREFTTKSDVLRGFAGVFAVMERHFKSETYSGLPAVVFCHALLWTPAMRIPRRGCRLPTQNNISMGKPDNSFPSWSWAGWDGGVEYRLFSDIDGDLQLPSAAVLEFRIGRGETSTLIKTCDSPSSATTDTISPGTRDIATEMSTDASARRYSTSVDPGQATDQNLPELKEVPSRNLSEKAPHPPATASNRGFAKLIPDESRQSTWIVVPPTKQFEQDNWDAPLSSNILTFSAPTVPVSAFHLSSQKEYLIARSGVHDTSSQAVRRIHDVKGNHCGLWWEQAGYGYVGLGTATSAEGHIHMAAVSQYGDVWHRRRGLSRVEGEIRWFDWDAFPAVGPGSGVVNLLVIDGGLERSEGVGWRCTVAVVHVMAWEAAGPRNRVIRVS